jgi:gamma-glutamyltranspeptidase/glutathione hydrolase
MPSHRFRQPARWLLALAFAIGPATLGAQVVESRTGLVVSASAPASDIGAAVLRAGGNAVDAAVATAFALAVTYPIAGNIGGGGFMVVRLADGRATTFDYRERAPLRATATMYLDSAGQIDRARAHTGYLSVGVPGTVRGLALAHRRFGRLPWTDLVRPAAELAKGGFVLSEAEAGGLIALVTRIGAAYSATVATYGKPGGGTWAAGDTLRLPDLARTLEAIAQDGPDVFYRGWIARLVARDMSRNGGLIGLEDLASYQAVERPAVRGSFLGHEIIGMAPPSSGGTAMVEALNILERFDLPRRQRFAPLTLHLIIEAMRRAFLDRAEFLGDADFGPVPVERLISKEHAARMAATIDTTRASVSAVLANDRIALAEIESDQTTHFSVVDRDGNAVANTYTLEQAYGSGIVVADAGFLLNNEMGDFNKKPGHTSAAGDIGTTANLVAPGKRMLSSMSPTIVARDGKPVLVTGSPGGRTIINTVLQIVLNVVAYGMDARAAVDAPRLHHQWLPDATYLEEAGNDAGLIATLRAMGHAVRAGGRQGDGHSILIDPATGLARGANDHRSPDSKAAAP